MSPVSVPSPSRPARGGARTAILDAAHTLVRRYGWTATTVDALCAEAGVTKGAFFHHFPSKEMLGIAAAEHWTAVTEPLFASAGFHRLEDPLDRVLGYLDFRAALAAGPVEEFCCFAGTTLQEVFTSSPGIAAACGASITGHAAHLAADLALAISRHAPDAELAAENLALYTQTVLQGGFLLSKATGNNKPLLDAIAHLKTYLRLIFQHREETTS